MLSSARSSSAKFSSTAFSSAMFLTGDFAIALFVSRLEPDFFKPCQISPEIDCELPCVKNGRPLAAVGRDIGLLVEELRF